MQDAPPPELDEETLERLRRSFALRLDRMGRFHFEGDAITHSRVVAYLRSCLDVSESGEPIVTLRGQWAYLHVDDLPLRVVRVRRDEAGTPLLVLDDERELKLDPSTLEEDEGGGLRARVPARSSGRPVPVRFTNTAAMDLDPWLSWPDPQGRPVLDIGGSRTPVPLRPAND